MLSKVISRMKSRWLYGIIAMVLLVLFLLIFIGPKAMLGQGIANYYSGIDSYTVTGSNKEFIQEFRPQHTFLSQIALDFVDKEERITQERINISIETISGEIVFQEALYSSEIAKDEYFFVETDLRLTPLKKYILRITFITDEAVPNTTLKVNPVQKQYKENVRLSVNDEYYSDICLLSGYYYENAIDKKNGGLVIGLLIISTIVFWMGLPSNKRAHYFVSGVLLVLAPVILQRYWELLVSDNTFFEVTKVVICNIIVIYIIWLILWLLLQSVRATIICGTLVCGIVYLANYYVLRFRGNPLKFLDIKAFGTAMSVASEYDFSLGASGVIAVTFMILSIAIASQIHITVKGKKRFVANGIGVMMIFVLVYTFSYHDVFGAIGIKYDGGILESQVYRENGYLVTTIQTLKYGRIDRPIDYSIEKVDEIILSTKEQPETDNEEQPHIILILNESFTDLSVLGDLTLSQDNLTFVHSLSENTVSGYVNASVIGGGTANSEFEVLTGCTTAFLPASYFPYLQSINSKKESMVSMLEEQGYTTISFHPNVASNWNRRMVYKAFGFEESYWIDSFEGMEYRHSGISDLSTYRKIIERFEQKKEGEKLFLYDLTMQNHGGYTNSSINITTEILNVNSAEGNVFASLISASDQDFKYLVDYFNEEEEEVIICMFGDHQPLLTDDFYEQVNSLETEQSEDEQLMNRYKTPFVIWANYDIEEKDHMDISLNYLGVLLLKTANVRYSSFFNYIDQLSAVYPIITRNGYADCSGVYYSWTDANPFEDYQILQYNYLIDYKNTSYLFGIN